MKSFFVVAPAIGLVLSTLASVGPVAAQQDQLPVLKPASPACMESARAILTMKNASAMYQYAVAGAVQQMKQQLVQEHSQYQKDLEELAVQLTQTFAGKEKAIGEYIAQAYCNEFSDQELKDLVVFYRSPLGEKLLHSEPRAVQAGIAYMSVWSQTFMKTVEGQFRAEMGKRGKQI